MEARRGETDLDDLVAVHLPAHTSDELIGEWVNGARQNNAARMKARTVHATYERYACSRINRGPEGVSSLQTPQY